MRALLVSLVAACGGSSAPVPVPVAMTVIATPRRSPDDVAVAQVNGRAVWASCVAAQAEALAAAPAAGSGVANPAASSTSVEQLRAAALDQCIAFELLAQAAEARGLAAAPEVAEAVRNAAVNRLVATDFEQRYRSPADLAPAVDAIMKTNEWRMHILELRASTFARFVVPERAAPEVEAEAHALAERLAAELAGQTGLYNVHLTEAATRLAAGTSVKLDASDVRPTHRDDLVDAYAAALYAIPEVGQTSPAVRTKWGWDVILWTGGVTAKERTRDEVVAEIFPELRRRQFQIWAGQIGKKLGVHIEVDPAPLEQQEAGDDHERAGSARPPAPHRAAAPPRPTP